MEPWIIALVVVGVVLAAALLVRRKHLRGRPEAPPMLEKGWQFYARPTTAEKPGTVFRIDEQGRRFIVAELEVKIKTASEAYGRYRESVEAHMGMVARLFGINGPRIDARAQKTEALVFELEQVEREYVEDKDLDGVLNPWLKQLTPRPENRYFIIRQALSAREITFRLEDDQVEELGGEAALDASAKVGGTLHASRSSGKFILEEQFKEQKRVIFLPEELRFRSDDQATETPELERHPVVEALTWADETRPEKTELDFLVDELIAPLAQRLGRRWLDAILGQVEPGMRSRLQELVLALSLPAENRGRQLESPEAELIRYVEHNPNAKAQLSRIARQPKVVVEREADADMRRLEQYLAMLVFVFDRVVRLRRPVALHGFFNCTNCVTVIDARTPPGSLSLPSISKSSIEPSPLEVSLSYNLEEAMHTGRPRVWILRADPDYRDSLATELNKQFSRARSHVTEPRFLANDLPTEPRAEFVTSIEADLVHTERQHSLAQFPPSDLPPDEYADKLLAAIEAREPDPADSDPFYEIGQATGINLLRDHLEKQLKDRWDEEQEWP